MDEEKNEIKILNHVSKFTLASETNVVGLIISWHGPLWQVSRLKAPSARSQKVILNEILYYICESWYEPFEKYASRSPGWFKNCKQWQLYRYVYWEQYERIIWILTNLSVVICYNMEIYWCVLFSNEFLQHCLFRNMCKWFSVFGVHFEHFEKNNCHSTAWIKFFV